MPEALIQPGMRGGKRQSGLALLAKVLAGLGILTYVAIQVGADKLLADLHTVSALSLGVAVCVMSGGILVTCRRWQVILAAMGSSIPLTAVLRMYLVGLFFNLAGMGGIGGYVYRAASLTRYTGSSGVSAASLILDRGMDALVLPALGLLGLGGYGFLANNWILVALANSGVLVYALLVYGGVRMGGSFARAAGIRLPWLARWPRFAREFADAFWLVRDRYSLQRKMLALSVLFQGCVILSNFVISQILRFDIPLWQFAAFMPLIALLNLFPLTFHGLGVIQVAYVYFFGLGGVEPSKALTLSLVVSLAGLVIACLGGLLFAWQCVVSMGAQRRAAGTQAAQRAPGGKASETYLPGPQGGAGKT